MKRYQITLGGRTFDIRLLSDPLKDKVDVEVDGEPFTVEVRALSPEAETPGPPSAGAEVMEGPGMPAAAPAAEPAEGLRPTSPPGNAITAPLPGVIKSITMRPGQQVSPGDELLVIEAMKMDNVIRATREGTVETIHVVEGRHVAHGELLLEYRA